MSKKNNENNKINLCKKIQNNIALLSQNELNEIFKILFNNDSKYTQNNNGIFVNLNWLEYDIILQINNYIDFCIKSHKEIKKHEIMKNMYNENLNKKKMEVDDIIGNHDSKEVVPENNVKVQKISSSMKFYLFKKKFQKKIQPTFNYTNVLSHENFLLKKNDI
tara:strand:+ start:9928 stop:10416 length:489 start_codon:yes stop_codon:yes gene_type:complete